MPVSGRLADMTAEGSSLRKSVSRGLSAHRRSLLGLSCSHRGIHLPCGRPTRRASRRDSDGVSVFRVVEIRPGWVLPLRRDGGVRTAGTASPTVTCRFSTANPVLRSRIPSPEGADNGAYGNSLHVHPSGLPQPVAPGWHRSPWALPRASHHPVTQVACRGGESVWTLARSQRRTPPSIPHPLRSLTSRDLTSHGCPQLHPAAATARRWTVFHLHPHTAAPRGALQIVPVLCPAVLCGQRRLAADMTFGGRLGGAAAGHIIITARRAS